MWASFTDNFIGEHTTEEVLDYILMGSSFYLAFKAIEQNIWELIDVHLLVDIRGLALVIFKSMAKLIGNVILGVTVQKRKEHFLNLV